ncbi:MAG: T9SS type A sorting domain-containing protein [Bacteroidota bacterium]
MRTDKIVFIIILLFISNTDLFGQHIPSDEFGDPAARRRTTIAANKLRLMLFNNGYLGRTGGGIPDEVPFEWPKYSLHHYIALSSLWIGGEVKTKQGSPLRIVSMQMYRNDPATGKSWNMEPVPSYMDPSGSMIARSSDPKTWPSHWSDKMGDASDPGWSGAWNGLTGKNKFIDGEELYYHYSDDRYDRYKELFLPDSTDPVRSGLGIVVSERVMEFSDHLLEDAVIIHSDIYNVGTSNIEKAAVTNWIADLVGGEGDSGDDVVSFDSARGIVFFTDKDGKGNVYFHDSVGVAAVAFLQTPGNLGLTNLQVKPAGTFPNFGAASDSAIWDMFMGTRSFVTESLASDNDAFASCGVFSIPAGSYKRFIRAHVFGKTKQEVIKKTDRLKQFINGGYSLHSYPVGIVSPLPNQQVSGTHLIRWDAGANYPLYRIDIYYSRDEGESWELLAENEPNDGSYSWNTNNVPDGIFYKIKIVAYTDVGLGVAESQNTFVVNNAVAARTEVRLHTSVTGKSYSGSIFTEWKAGDADGDEVVVDLSYKPKPTGNWIPVINGISGISSYNLDIKDLPNVDSLWLRITARSVSDSAWDSTGSCAIRNPRYSLKDTGSIIRKTKGNGVIQPRVVNPASVLTGHTYKVLFHESPEHYVYYDVYDETTAKEVVSGAREIDGEEGPLFDGIRLFIQNGPTAWNKDRTRWNNEGIHSPSVVPWNIITKGIPEPADFVIAFSDSKIDTSIYYLPASFYKMVSIPVNFTIKNVNRNQKSKFAFRDVMPPANPADSGMFTVGSGIDQSDLIAIMHTDSSKPSWRVNLVYDAAKRNPTSGDTLFIAIDQPFSEGDEYMFEAGVGVLSVSPSQVAGDFSLSQNYPNPFNPVTTIKYQIPSAGYVTLKVYDVLGREVATLIHGQHLAGNYSTVFNASRLASGIYFYKLTMGNNTMVKRMSLVK